MFIYRSLAVWSFRIILSIVSGFVVGGIFVFVYKYPEAALLLIFAAWVLRFGWKESRAEEILHMSQR